MKVAGIIAEYDPLHNGHIYQLRAAREKYGADAVIIILGSDFTQRGLPAVVDRHARAKWALTHGADLVIGMPIQGGCDSAEGFASSGVGALAATGVVTDIIFGAETDDLGKLSDIASVLSEPDLSDIIMKKGSTGISYPVILSEVLSERLGEDAVCTASSPNNILSIEYLKALKRTGAAIIPHDLKRLGAAHNSVLKSEALAMDDKSQDTYDAAYESSKESAGILPTASSSAIRAAYESGDTQSLSEAMPPDVERDLNLFYKANELIFPIDTALLLSERLISCETYDNIYGVSEDLSNRIKNMRDGYENTSAFAESLKSKNLTRSHIDRALCHILLGLRNEDMLSFKAAAYTPYLNILGIKQGTGEKLLASVISSSSVPVLTSPKDAAVLSEELISIYKKDLYACDLYRIIKTQKSGRTYPTEYTRRFLKV
ncbi:MAG: nucleotidyltransferase family protein [Lachnospiraceae bacterium]|nr:nucleotidyltransferase family protein [Lachnospiraceae bacterium]